eukprot:TRINITY_DN7865_c0_g1_i1.p1 TRINITY_DN7865_c0_g1~~TRINITY_DN7865_c0_g1_i1.p1  ORF type:complete len:266 (+),score=47.21 TRINITY_DN7865_c0_g1_i1:168-965(+)
MASTLAFLKRSSLQSSTSERGNRLWADMTPTPRYEDESPHFGLHIRELNSDPTSCRGRQRIIRFAELTEVHLPTQERPHGRKPTASTTYDDVFLDSCEVYTDASTSDADGPAFRRMISLESSTPSWCIKNTFINVEDADEELSSPCALPKKYISSPDVFSPQSQREVEVVDDIVSNSSSWEARPLSEVTGPPPPPGVWFSGDVQPALSAGSMQHRLGNCKPCAWFYKPQGCQNGAECRHCHLCPKGEIRRRKKERQGKDGQVDLE